MRVIEEKKQNRTKSNHDEALNIGATYFKEVSNHNLLTAEEEKFLARKAIKGDQLARQK
ncbi:sigma-70 factor domain-containing protein [Vibrio hippocampi]|uniref:RNA polymerase sigma-70 region 1.2 domain-containing protein n=1 Tax=Vibrio hippocampi TaxID=654686 RepID=A0ABN8DFP3_9VIBR|nr:sigma-70 factor domain-containing protein [Vibrio hippocampi]CAH0526124.1 hypothetical protein VHP8226_01598 [Vibrio hippocampi]